MREIVLGKKISSQVRSSNREADFWPIVRLVSGGRRWMMVGKYPRRLENLNMLEGDLNFRLSAARLSSSAKTNPVRVTNRAVSFR